LLLLLSSCNWEDPKGSMVVMTLNVRYDNPSDAPNDWKGRKPIIISTVLDRSADIIGFQEVLKNQLDDLDSLLPWYDYVGVGRDDGTDKGEFSPVFYKMNRFEALGHGTIWLSENPLDTGSVGWDAALPRIMTWVKFRDMHLQRQGEFFEFYFLNTHFDHIGDTARKESAVLLLDFIHENTDGLDVVLTGDFNFTPDEEPYTVMISVDKNDSGLEDAIGVTSPEIIENGEPTYNGFGQSADNKRIDFIFVSPGWDVLSYERLKVIENGIYISDHYPVISRIKTNQF
jgi:endonuclease/exonuclease/phosphatase family metal-dependent hydrolase